MRTHLRVISSAKYVYLGKNSDKVCQVGLKVPTSGRFEKIHAPVRSPGFYGLAVK